MVDFRSSGVQAGGLGVFKATQSLSSPAASSLDKPAGTLSAKTIKDIAQTGVAAQRLIESTPRQITKDYSAAQRSYTYAENLLRQDVFLGAEAGLIDKYLAQASPEQKTSLWEAAQTATSGVQKAIQTAIAESPGGWTGGTDKSGQPLGNWQGLLVLGAIALIGYMLVRKKR